MQKMNPMQKEQANKFMALPDDKKCEEIAKMCNEKNISKTDLEMLLNSIKR